jgi:hypothetical protein
MNPSTLRSFINIIGESTSFLRWNRQTKIRLPFYLETSQLFSYLMIKYFLSTMNLLIIFMLTCFNSQSLNSCFSSQHGLVQCCSYSSLTIFTFLTILVSSHLLQKSLLSLKPILFHLLMASLHNQRMAFNKLKSFLKQHSQYSWMN